MSDETSKMTTPSTTSKDNPMPEYRYQTPDHASFVVRFDVKARDEKDQAVPQEPILQNFALWG